MVLDKGLGLETAESLMNISGEYVDYDIQEALNMTKDIPEEQFEISKMLVR